MVKGGKYKMKKLDKFLETWKLAGRNVSVAHEHPIMCEIQTIGELVKSTYNIARKKGVSEAVNYLGLAYDLLYKPAR